MEAGLLKTNHLRCVAKPLACGSKPVAHGCQSVMQMGLVTLLFCLPGVHLLMGGANHAQAQVLSGPWVQQQEERIDRHRKGSIRVIVLDARGQAVPDAQIHVAMQRHDFQFGVRLDPAYFKAQNELPSNEAAGETDTPAETQVGEPADAQALVQEIPQAQQPIWRLLNAVSIESPARWHQLEPQQNQFDWTQAQRMLDWAAQRELAVHWGEVVTTNATHLPVWLTALSNDELAQALEAHVTTLSQKLAGRAASWDVIAGLPDRHYIQKRLGDAMLRRLVAQAAMHSPKVERGVRFNDTLAGPRLTEMVQSLTEMRDLQTPITSVTMDIKLGGNVAYVSLERSLEWLSKIGLPIRMMNMEVAGPSPQAAAINLETALRTFFAQPQVEGIWLGGIGVDQVLDPSSALVNQFGQLTPAGDLFVKMVGTRWWSEEIVQADELGNARLKVFAGAYKIQAVWPDGQAATSAYIKPGQRTQLIIIQQLADQKASD